MKQEDIKILIVDDDPAFGASLKESLIKADYKSTFLATTPNEAIYYNKIHFINCFIIDCLLPQMQGLELALKLEETDNSNEKSLFFMSGVFQESEIFDEIKRKTQAKDFLSKPFSPDVLINKLNQQFVKHQRAKNNLLNLISSKDNLSVKKRLSTISDIEKAHGFALPQIIKLLLCNKISGVLDLKINDKKHQIYFSKGKIIFIELNSKDKKSLFGDILIKNNILSFEELQPFLNKTDSGKIGEKLINANLISPHMIDIITKEQVSIRLNQLIKDVYYETSFEETSMIPSNKQATSITQKDLKSIYIQYLKLNIPVTYIKNIYVDKLNDQIQINSDSLLLDFIFPSCEKTIDILRSIRNENHSLLSLLNKYSNFNNDIYFIVHLLILSDLVYFQTTKESETVQVKVLRLERIVTNIKKQNYFEILNVSRKSKHSDINQSYKDLLAIFYPNEFNSQGSKEVKDLLTIIFNYIKKAYDVLSDPKKRNSYELSLEHENFKSVLESKQIFKEAKKALHANNRKTALDLLEKVMKIDPSPSIHVQLYFIWSQLANFYRGDSQHKIADIKTYFDRISPEHRNTALFYFVKGLFHKTLGDKEAAMNHLKYAQHLDPHFKEVKQELQALAYSYKKPLNIFKSDLKEVIKSLPFFKKKIG